MTKEDFTSQVLECEARMYLISKSILHRDEDCADAMQNAILKAYSNLGKLEEDKYFRTWLIRILINECYDLLQEQKTLSLDEMDVGADCREAQAVDLEEKIILKDALKKLQEKYRTPCVLHYLSGYSVKEISTMLHLSESAVKMRLLRGKKQLGEMLRES